MENNPTGTHYKNIVMDRCVINKHNKGSKVCAKGDKHSRVLFQFVDIKWMASIIIKKTFNEHLFIISHESMEAWTHNNLPRPRIKPGTPSVADHLLTSRQITNPKTVIKLQT